MTKLLNLLSWKHLLKKAMVKEPKLTNNSKSSIWSSTDMVWGQSDADYTSIVVLKSLRGPVVLKQKKNIKQNKKLNIL